MYMLHTVCIIRTRYVIHDMPAAALAAWEARDHADKLSNGDELLGRQLVARAAEIAALGACTPGLRTDSAVLLRDADAIGPCWPGIPGPNLCDLNSLVIARWLTVPSPSEYLYSLSLSLSLSLYIYERDSRF